MKSKINWISQVDSHLRLYISVVIGIAVFFILGDMEKASIHWMSSWLAFSGTYLFLCWMTILSCHPRELHKIAEKQDSGRSLVMILILIASLISLIGIILFYRTSGEMKDNELLIHILLTILSAIFAWWLVHTTFTFKYAHLYYAVGEQKEGRHVYGGLDFPDENTPDYLDFCYFSFVLGTTFQVSDVNITARHIRRIALLHGLLSFFFNTIILALSINIIAGLIEK
ncbi:DUF1345 domain-containing protein [Flavobacterium sp. NPDC079362]|uniref:DUF1345 domain-containing protein n=1 Tax=Flavobacterium collinsii TaxID=1114861 RepID=A0ABN7EI90_9FLAO|nr:DUF1345 domain-containing protein [Flavobacterium collinsii]CAA9197761.1 hypothetical protein FLACOL7796_01833 [Flavobacterium collinsii]